MACCGFGYGLGYGGLGYGLGGCCAPCIPPYFPTCVKGCPVQISPCDAIYPDACGAASFCNPCYGGISGPAVHCEKKKCCETSTGCNGCSNNSKPKNQWFKPGTKVSVCNCNC